jgi:hypothetical protein
MYGKLRGSKSSPIVAGLLANLADQEFGWRHAAVPAGSFSGGQTSNLQRRKWMDLIGLNWPILVIPEQ